MSLTSCMLQRFCLITVCAGFISACSFWGGGDRTEEVNYGATLADLGEPILPETLEPIQKTSIDKIEESYRSALEVAKDPDIRHRILIRLADLEMARSEERQLVETEEKKYFGDAISMYRELIELNAERQGESEDTPTNERLLYQLSKAYALDGNIEDSDRILGMLNSQFPKSDFAAEAKFRRAEQAFSDRKYGLAEKLYAEVMSEGDQTPFYGNAVYMHGWSLFKLGRYRASIRSYTEVLDRTLVENVKYDELSNTEKNLIGDTLRILGIVFSYLDGAQTITEVYSKLGHRHYQHMLYMNLGDLYLEKKRYRDSADTYRHYVKHFASTDHAPSFSVKAIEVYSLGNFPSLILPAKEEYVRNYGVYSEFWRVRDDEQRKPLLKHLNTYLDELSSYYHEMAINTQGYNAEYKKLVEQGKKPKQKPDNPGPIFVKAAEYYEEFVKTFPQNPKTPEMAFLMGEAYFEAGRLAAAISAYETVAYNYVDEKRGAEAGYAAIIALQMLADGSRSDRTSEKTVAEWKAHKINSAITFADYYPGDKRAPVVLTKAAQEIFESGDLLRAAKIATRMTQWQPKPEKSLLKTSWLVLAHSRFDLEQYNEAEWAYREVLKLLPANSKERPEVIDRIAASMYRSSELLIAGGDKPAAIEKLLAIAAIAPKSDIAISGQYDAATHLIDLKEWGRAEQVLSAFKKNFPKHKLTATLPPKFALIYQETEQWDKAADVLSGMAKNDSDPEMRRQSLYLSAQLFEKSGNLQKAVVHYREYAHTYADPFDLATEARFRLVELYTKSKEDNKRNYWLKKLIDEDKKAGAKRTDRSKYLAAFASNEFARNEANRFDRIKLTLPIKKSLKKKKAAMDRTLKAYKGVLGYGVAEFATEANYRIGMIYAQLSRDLMDSQRPKGLDDLALEQYEILLEEQAFPFEEKSIDIHTANAQRSWEGIYDDWVKNSFSALAKLLPARYNKQENVIEVSDDLH